MNQIAETSNVHAAADIKYEIVEFTRGRGLDLGCGPDKLYPHFTSVDFHGADIEADITDLKMIDDATQDFVLASMVLEGITCFESALLEWWRVLKDGGHLLIHGFDPVAIIRSMERMSPIWDLRVCDTEDTPLLVFRKGGEDCTRSYLDPKPEKTCAIVRYGGFGDMLQVSSILPGLKEQGYHITYYTTPRGYNIVRTDPHIDAFYQQGNDQVPNQELSAFWEVHEKRFDKFINLTESIEGRLLALPGRKEFDMTAKHLHQKMNRNYLGTIHKIAGVPGKPQPHFYPTDEELEWVDGYIKDLDCDAFILWALSGSSGHKAYPYTDNVIANILTNSDNIKIVFVGDIACQILEYSWKHEKRVIRESGRLSIRKTLTLAQRANLVIGPETGVLNCVAYEDVPKVIMLSHSSPVNIGGTWPKTDVMVPKGVKCYPCHKLHYGWSTCNRDEVTGGAQCAAAISPYKVFSSIRRRLSA